MTPTDKVLGQIAAMSTFIENFPMSILDMMQGKTYTSIFDFMIDVLVACGVDINDIIQFLLEKIYGVEENINDGLEGFYEKLKNGAVEVNTQNEFLEGLEYAIKDIFMALLSSIYTCSAIPILPNKMFDGPNPKTFEDNKSNAFGPLQDKNNEWSGLLIPTSVIDPMGLLDIDPTSTDGRMFYAIEGGDRYFKKELVPHTEYVTVKEIQTKDETIEVPVFVEQKLFDKQIGVGIKRIQQAADNTEEDINKFYVTGGPAEKDIIVQMSYQPYGSKSSYAWEGTIPKGESETIEEWICSPVDMFGAGRKSIIQSISINNNGGSIDLGDKTWVYLSSGASTEFISIWSGNGLNAISWGAENDATTKIESAETKTVTKDEEIEVEKAITKYDYEYVEVQGSDIDSNANIERVNFVPTSGITTDSPSYIVFYDGLNPNLLYKSMDMNAFLWYVLHKGMKTPQVEYNHMMWDSRVSALKQGVSRKSAEEWNEWYNSKTGYTEEFKYFGSTIVEDTPIFPIMQLEGQGMAENLLKVHIPAQRYFLPKVRNANIDRNEIPRHAFNASMYKYNWDYLNNIQILKPKLLLVGLCEHLLGFSLSTISSTNINFTKKLIESKLSSAIKSVIEANDMEVEDCYMEFSNDEVNAMLEEMLLSRYNATTYGGETATVRVHDTKKYIAMLDQVNANTSVEGNMTTITKLLTEVTTDPGTEGSIDYGLKVSTDGNILKKLLWAIVMPLLMSIFTPQVMLLLYMNFELMGITKIDTFNGQDFTKIINLIMNKIFGLLKSIILFIKDKIVELLLILLYEKILPILMQYQAILLLERITFWLAILKDAISCVPMFSFKRNKVIGAIDSVDYADIIPSQDTPESTSSC